MARKPMVTRTVKSTIVTAKVYNLDTNEVGTMEFVLPRTYSEPKELEKALNRANVNPAIKVLTIVDTKEQESLYGMDEQKFIENAEILPPRGEKTTAPVNE